ncbi:hypothetical protein [Streptosporangium sp. NPDC002524]|uniref:hypothetical protein n=1 Tax=Streptosporangium sp. NPDC002524 TaxID=3154537 RepID=UPI00332361E3
MTRRDREHQAARRLTERHGDEMPKRLAEKFDDYAMGPLDGLIACGDAVRRIREPDQYGVFPPTNDQDVDDGLLLLVRARWSFAVDQVAIIEQARANGRTWEEIADLMGVPVSRAKNLLTQLRKQAMPLS